MKQIFHGYQHWECYQAGMYSDVDITDRDGYAEYARFLADIPRFKTAMYRVIAEWPRSCEHFLSNPSVNRIAWLGQSAMCIETGISRKYRSGFRLLTADQQASANQAANTVLVSWIAEHLRDSSQLEFTFPA